jgi:hypothetical protein
MDKEAVVASPIVAAPVDSQTRADITSTRDAHHVHVQSVVGTDGRTKKSKKKKIQERAERVRPAKSVEPDDANYNDMCRQLVAMQKELNLMKTKVGFSRPKTAKKQSDTTAVVQSSDDASTPSTVVTTL